MINFYSQHNAALQKKLKNLYAKTFLNECIFNHNEIR